MFDNLTDRLSSSLRKVTGRSHISEDNIKETLREVRMALLEADVALPVVKAFIDQVKARAVGAEIGKGLDAGQAFIKIVNEELTKVIGTANETLDLRAQPPAVMLMAGLQGAGKTTTTAKLARFLKDKEKKKVMVVSCDVYRPAAIEQLKTVAEQVDATFFPSSIDQNPVDIAKAAIDAARKQHIDVVLVDTAGRLHVDSEMMDEIKGLHAAIKPVETLFVVDSMTGQDAANTAKAFDDALPLTGVILTKTDGDARGGAALSIRHITGKPIKFLGVGEKVEALEPFHPDRLASRILGMGDILSLIEDVEAKVDKQKAEKLAKKITSGKGRFTLTDMRDQLEQVNNMGDIGGLLSKMPGMAGMAKQMAAQVNNKDIARQIAIINSMTKKERRNAEIIKGSRKRRIAAGAGLQIVDVSRLLKQHKQMEKMMKKMGGGGMTKMMRGMGGMMGQMPGGAPGGGQGQGGLPGGMPGAGGLGANGLPPLGNKDDKGKFPF